MTTTKANPREANRRGKAAAVTVAAKDKAEAKPATNAKATARETFDRLADSTLLTIGEVAGVLGMSEITMKKWRQAGRGPKAVKVGGYALRYPVGAIREYIKEQQQAS